MEPDDTSPTVRPDDADELEPAVVRARHAVVTSLSPEPPDVAVIRRRAERRHRGLAAAAAIVVLVALGAGVVAIQDGSTGDDHVIADSGRTTASEAEPASSIEPDTPWHGATLMRDGRTLVLTVPGPEGDGPCEHSYDHDVVETDEKVVIGVETQPSPPTTGPVVCNDMYVPLTIKVTLDRPLENRKVFNGIDPSAQFVADRRELVEVTYVPEGFAAEEPRADSSLPKWWQQIFHSDEGADWYFSVVQDSPEDFGPGGAEIGPVTVHGIEGERYGGMNGTLLTIHWVEDGLDISVWGEMQGPPTFTHEAELLRIAEGIQLPD